MRSNTISQKKYSQKFNLINGNNQSNNNMLPPILNGNQAEDNDSDTEEKLNNFKRLVAEKFPLNIYVGSELIDKKQEMKVYNGKYIKTFIVNKEFKLQFNSNLEEKPKRKLNGNSVYFEQEVKPILNFSRMKSKILSKLPNSTRNKEIKLNDYSTTINNTNHKEDELKGIEKKYGLTCGDYLKYGDILKTSQTTRNLDSKTKSFFKNNDFYYN